MGEELGGGGLVIRHPAEAAGGQSRVVAAAHMDCDLARPGKFGQAWQRCRLSGAEQGEWPTHGIAEVGVGRGEVRAIESYNVGLFRGKVLVWLKHELRGVKRWL